jgi:hypothetical protein
LSMIMTKTPDTDFVFGVFVHGTLHVCVAGGVKSPGISQLCD